MNSGKRQRHRALGCGALLEALEPRLLLSVVVYQQNYDALAAGQVARSPGAAGQDGYYDNSAAFPVSQSNIQSAIANGGQALLQVSPSSLGAGAQTIADRGIPAVLLSNAPVVGTSVDFYADTSNLSANNPFSGIFQLLQSGGGLVAAFDVGAGNGPAKSASGLHIDLSEFNGSNNNVRVNTTVGQNLTWDAWHHVSLTVDYSTQTYQSLTVDGVTEDLTGVPLPRSFNGGQPFLPTEIDMVDQELIASPFPGAATTDQIAWDNVKVEASAVAAPDAFEPYDNVATQAISLLQGFSQVHTISSAQDVDWYTTPANPADPIILMITSDAPTSDFVMNAYASPLGGSPVSYTAVGPGIFILPPQTAPRWLSFTLSSGVEANYRILWNTSTGGGDTTILQGNSVAGDPSDIYDDPANGFGNDSYLNPTDPVLTMGATQAFPRTVFTLINENNRGVIRADADWSQFTLAARSNVTVAVVPSPGASVNFSLYDATSAPVRNESTTAYTFSALLDVGTYYFLVTAPGVTGATNGVAQNYDISYFATPQPQTNRPLATISYAPSQGIPTNASTIAYVAQFNEPVTGFDGTGVNLPSGVSVIVSPQNSASAYNTVFNIYATGITSNLTVTIGIFGDSASDASGRKNVEVSYGYPVVVNKSFSPTAVSISQAGVIYLMQSGGMLEGFQGTSAVGTELLNVPVAQLQTLTLTGSAVTLDLSTAFSLSTLSLTGGATLALVNGSPGRLTLAQLSIDASSRLDLGNDDLVISTSNSAAAYAAVLPLLSATRNNGSWTGSGLGTSAANANQGLSVVRNDELGQPFATWHGTAVGATALLITKVWRGDANDSGAVNIDDFLAIDAGFLRGKTDYANGDFNFSGTVNAADYALINAAFSAQNQPAAARGLQSAASAAAAELALVVPVAAALAEHFDEARAPRRFAGILFWPRVDIAGGDDSGLQESRPHWSIRLADARSKQKGWRVLCP